MRAKPRKLGKYLWDRPESRFIWFRMSVPARYREVAGTLKVQESLETADVVLYLTPYVCD